MTLASVTPIRPLPQRIVGYTIVQHATTDSTPLNMMERKINELLRAGWQPWGEMKVIGNGTSITFVQIMIKYEQ